MGWFMGILSVIIWLVFSFFSFFGLGEGEGFGVFFWVCVSRGSFFVEGKERTEEREWYWWRLILENREGKGEEMRKRRKGKGFRFMGVGARGGRVGVRR